MEDAKKCGMWKTVEDAKKYLLSVFRFPILRSSVSQFVVRRLDRETALLMSF